VFGTYAQCKLWCPEAEARAASAEIEELLLQLHDTINVFDPDSELSRLNTQAHETAFVCSDRLWGILLSAREAYEETGGVFDISVGPLMAVWGFRGPMVSEPTTGELARALERTGLDKVVFDDEAQSVRFTRSGMSLDFGGLAKGYGLDLAATVLLRRGLDRGLVDLGGNIRCLSVPPPGKTAYSIGIRHPFDPENMMGTVAVLDACVATSGNYEKEVVVNGRRIGHILDPRSGRPVEGVAGVTVVTARGADSDVFSTAIFAGGDALVAALRSRAPDTRIARVVRDRGAGWSLDLMGEGWSDLPDSFAAPWDEHD
jgi:thiamine biosynthesis lipoprotein